MRSVLTAAREAEVFAFADAITDGIGTVTNPLVARIASLERRCAELQSALAILQDRALSYEQIWDGTRGYARGAMVTFKSTLWHAQRDIQPGERPGASEAAWKLMVKYHDAR